MKRIPLVLALILLVGATFALAACTTPAPTAVVEPTAEPTIAVPTEMPTEAPALADMITTLQNDGRFTTLLKLIGTAGITDTLTGPGPITLLAPTDEAFAALPAGTLDKLTPEQVKNILLAHVIGQKILSTDVSAAPEMKIEGTSLVTGTIHTITSDGTNLTVDEKAQVAKADIETTNGAIQIIGVVLLPEQTPQ